MFPSLGALGVMVTICDTWFAIKVDSILGNFSVSIILDVIGRG